LNSSSKRSAFNLVTVEPEYNSALASFVIFSNFKFLGSRNSSSSSHISSCIEHRPHHYPLKRHDLLIGGFLHSFIQCFLITGMTLGFMYGLPQGCPHCITWDFLR
jgi:hypothetical protein